MIPIIIEVALLGYPFYFILNRLNRNIIFSNYAMLLGLFVVEYAVTNWIVGFAFPFIKICISAVLFCAVFHKQLSLATSKRDAPRSRQSSRPTDKVSS